MTIETKYNIGDKVLIRKNRIDGNPPDYIDGEVVMIYFHKSKNVNSIRYRVQYRYDNSDVLTSDVLEDELIKYQRSGVT